MTLHFSGFFPRTESLNSRATLQNSIKSSKRKSAIKPNKKVKNKKQNAPVTSDVVKET